MTKADRSRPTKASDQVRTLAKLQADEAGLPKAARNVLGYLASISDWPNLVTKKVRHEIIAKRCGVVRRTVIRAVQELIDAELLVDLDQGLRNRSHRYRVLIEVPEDLLQVLSRAIPTTSDVTPMSHQVSHQMSHQMSHDSPIPSTTTSAGIEMGTGRGDPKDTKEEKKPGEPTEAELLRLAVGFRPMQQMTTSKGHWFSCNCCHRRLFPSRDGYVLVWVLGRIESRSICQRCWRSPSSPAAEALRSEWKRWKKLFDSRSTPTPTASDSVRT